MTAPVPAEASSPQRGGPARVLKAEAATLVEVLGSGPEAVVRKTYRSRGVRLLQTWLRASRAHREHDRLAVVQAAGLPCTEPVAWSERRQLGLVPESVLVTRFVPGCRPVKEVLQGLPPATAGPVRAALVRRMGELVAALHRKGVLWGTPMPRNFLLRGEPMDADLLLCDLPAAIVHRRSIHGEAAATVDLFEAAFSPSRRRDFSAAERLRWLRAYCEGDRAQVRRLWRVLNRRTRPGNDLRKAWRRLFGLYLRG